MPSVSGEVGRPVGAGNCLVLLLEFGNGAADHSGRTVPYAPLPACLSAPRHPPGDRPEALGIFVSFQSAGVALVTPGSPRNFFPSCEGPRQQSELPQDLHLHRRPR